MHLITADALLHPHVLLTAFLITHALFFIFFNCIATADALLHPHALLLLHNKCHTCA
jgi:hypothetical protein